MLIDTHAHLNFNAFREDADEVIRRSLENNVWMLNVGSQYTTSKRAVEIARKYGKGVFAAVGLHPIHLASGIFKTKIDREEIEFRTAEEEFNYEKYRELAKSPKVVAIGEIGLDYYYRPKTKKKLEEFKNRQKEVFLKQLELAKELNLPVIFHCRLAHDDLIKALSKVVVKYCYSNILQQFYEFPAENRQQIEKGKHLKGVVHCFTGTWEQAQKYLEMGLYLGFNGLIFKLDFDEIIKKTPLEKILLETDCPYLTPPQVSGRNEPIYVKYIAEKIAKIKNLGYEEIAKITTKNAKELFNLV